MTRGGLGVSVSRCAEGCEEGGSLVLMTFQLMIVVMGDGRSVSVTDNQTVVCGQMHSVFNRHQSIKTTDLCPPSHPSPYSGLMRHHQLEAERDGQCKVQGEIG